MATLADLITWRDALHQARFAGVRAVEYDGRRTEFRSDTEMRAALADLDRRIEAAQGTTRIRMVRIASSKGV